MPLGLDNPEWRALYEALADLCDETGATHGAVFDEAPIMWCAYNTDEVTPHDVEISATDVFTREVAPIKASVRRGARLSVCRSGRDDALYIAESFAGIYVLALWFRARFLEELVRARVRIALPKIEALTLALPPPDGPDETSGAGRREA